MANKALLVGINKFSIEKYNLRGCVDDVTKLRALLTDVYGFEAGGVTTLLDGAATRSAILDGLRGLVADAQDGDRLLFAVSSHGTQKGFGVASEPDGKHEAIVPHDVSYNSLILDDELFNIIAPAVDGKRLNFTAIYDTCHSGTMIRELAFDIAGDPIEPVINRCLHIDELEDMELRAAQLGPYNVLSACKDDETAADLRDAAGSGRPGGAFSTALHERLRAQPDTPLGQLEQPVLARIRALSKHPQNPQYYATDASLPFLVVQ